MQWTIYLSQYTRKKSAPWIGVYLEILIQPPNMLGFELLQNKISSVMGPCDPAEGWLADDMPIDENTANYVLLV
jgi:hypothetical protein